MLRDDRPHPGDRVVTTGVAFADVVLIAVAVVCCIFAILQFRRLKAIDGQEPDPGAEDREVWERQRATASMRMNLYAVLALLAVVALTLVNLLVGAL